MSEHAYWNAVRDLVEDGHAQGLPKQQIRAAIIELVEGAHADGEYWAAEVLARWNDRGAGGDYTRAFKGMYTTTYIRGDGRRVRKTVGYSRPQRSQKTGEVIGRQMQAYWGMSRAAITELRREMFALGECIDDVVTALDQIIAAMERHPECVTARDAWEADGRDIAEVDLKHAA